MPRLSKIGAAALAAFGWTSGASGVTVDFLVIAGGGGGGGQTGAGGGAGGYRTSAGTSGGGASAEAKLSLNPTQSYTVTVGSGGAKGGATTSGSSGSASSLSTITTTGGGGGGTNSVAGLSGGSGGGAGYAQTGGAGTTSQGYAGGNGGPASSNYTGGGGGGAGAVGTAGTATVGGNGGNGVSSSISGTAVTRAGGGGGGTFSGGTLGTGGTGGGGNAGVSADGTTNTGSGGGGAKDNGTDSGNGGSGIVIISYVGAQQFGGGVVTSSGGNTIHTFTTSGTLGPITTLSASYLIVAGGGSGGGTTVGLQYPGGGGGAGGLLSGTGLTIDTNSNYLVTVGAGGAGTSTGSNSGTNSLFSMVTTTAVGGGAGGYNGGNGTAGGSGGGGSFTSSTGGAGTSGQGNTGGNGALIVAGGGGGASAVGGNGVASTSSGNGGAGTASSITGASVTYAGGGGGGASGVTAGTGGSGGGGAGSSAAGVAPTAGTANTGGGGGGTAHQYYGGGGNGGSGVVIISYAGSTQQMAGGTVTITGGNVIHTFTSSGYLAPLKYVGNSLRFRSSASAYLNRTLTTPTNNLKWTWSAWIKRGTLSVANVPFGAGDGSSNNFGSLQFTTSDTLQFAQISGGAYNLQMVTSAVFRDPAAWYHIQVVYDSANATSTDRVQIYVNGVRQSVTYTTGPFAQNTASKINSAIAHYISKLDYTTVYFDGYQTEINFIDGQALTPSSFGTINSYGVWQPITYGGSYGTNGFYLPFTNKTSTTTLGYDFSPNGNNWTTNNISLTTGVTYDSMTDVPTLTSATAANYAVWNPLDKGTVTVTNANLSAVSGADVHAIRASMGLPLSGKFYWETTVSGLGYGSSLGIANAASNLTTGSASAETRTYQWGSWFNSFNGGVVQYGTNQAVTGGTNWSGASQLAASDVLMIAVDMDNGSMWVGKNGTWFNSSGTANPATNTDPRWTGLGGTTWFAYYSSYGTTSPPTANINFGQRPFSFSPPSGYVALNTYNL